jgi:hypothetical protein
MVLVAWWLYGIPESGRGYALRSTQYTAVPMHATMTTLMAVGLGSNANFDNDIFATSVKLQEQTINRSAGYDVGDFC